MMNYTWVPKSITVSADWNQGDFAQTRDQLLCIIAWIIFSETCQDLNYFPSRGESTSKPTDCSVQRISESGAPQSDIFYKKNITFWGEPREASECLNIVLNRKYIKIPDRRKFFGWKILFYHGEKSFWKKLYILSLYHSTIFKNFNECIKKWDQKVISFSLFAKYRL